MVGGVGSDTGMRVGVGIGVRSGREDVAVDS